MNGLGKIVVKMRYIILIVSVLLLIPSAIGFLNTRINYDILSYLPKDIETMKGQDILLDEFGTGGFSMCVVEGMDNKDVSSMKKEMEKVDHVKKIIWYDSIADLSIPMDMLPDKVHDFFINKDKDSTLMVALYDTSLSADETMNAVKELRKVANKNCYISGMSAIVTDIKDLVEKEIPVYVIVAVILSTIVLQLTMDSAAVPIFFLLSIGMAIIYNLGTNFIKGEISYLTQALTAVLQLGVTMDYSIFLWHSYEEEIDLHPEGDKKEAMATAINKTIVSVFGSSITTVAGFIALCFMSFTLGLDLGSVMAKGVVLGVIGCVTILPSMILVFDKIVQKTRHRAIIPDLGFIGKFIANHAIAFVVLFVVILVPALWGYTHYDVYYDLVGSLPKSLDSIIANKELEENFNTNAVHIVIADSSLSQKQSADMEEEIKNVPGVKAVLGADTIVSPVVPKDILPEDLLEKVENDDVEMIMISSEYQVASDEVNKQCTTINKIIKKYDDSAMLIGEAPCTKDLIDITAKDFKVVSIVSIALVFLIILVVFKSISLPVILVSVIEFAIFINMGLAYYTDTTLPFIASIVIGTIQLGATVDYAILMTNKYKIARTSGAGKKEAIQTALQGSIQSVIVSALSFFAATFGVGIYSNVDMISSLCGLMSRGAIVSMIVVIFILPAMLNVFDKVIIKTSMGFENVK
ncbi:MAG: MMPL family transporter [Lachnospiraceae bacterium]|nr:MMPL family transporter [Lachnospiraceae bacterium]